jgi:hypothetical protein
MTETKTTETPRLNRAYEAAVRRLVHGFDNVTHEAAEGMAKQDGDECVSMPMWGTLFGVSDSCDKRAIQKLMVSPAPDENDDIKDLLAFAEERGIEIPDDFWEACGKCDECREDNEPDCEAPNYENTDTDDLATHLRGEWLDSGDEDAQLASDGWEDVGDTGLIAREFYGDLLLGINGCGYSFYGNIELGERDGHWPRLYDALGYSWHVQGYRADAAAAAARALCKFATPDHDAFPGAFSLLQRRVKAHGDGGPLTVEEIAECEEIDSY